MSHPVADVWCSWISWSMSFSCTCCHWRTAHQQSPCRSVTWVVTILSYRGKEHAASASEIPWLENRTSFGAWKYLQLRKSEHRVGHNHSSSAASFKRKKSPPEKNLCMKCSENGSPGTVGLLENGITHTAVYLLPVRKGAWGYWIHMAVRRAESQESIKVFNWNIFSKFRLNLIQILIIKNLWLSFLILKGNRKKKEKEKERGRGKKKIRIPVTPHYVTKSKKSYCWLLCDTQFPTGYCDEHITISDWKLCKDIDTKKALGQY